MAIISTYNKTMKLHNLSSNKSIETVSKTELDRFQALQELEKKGTIKNLMHQPITIVADQEDNIVIKYKFDFYYEQGDDIILEEHKNKIPHSKIVALYKNYTYGKRIIKAMAALFPDIKFYLNYDYGESYFLKPELKLPKRAFTE